MLLILILLQLNMFLIDLRLKICVISRCLFVFDSVFDHYKTQEMCNKADNDFLPALKFVPDWFVTSKRIKNFLLFYMKMIIYSILTKILVMPDFLVMKWTFLV